MNAANSMSRSVPKQQGVGQLSTDKATPQILYFCAEVCPDEGNRDGEGFREQVL